MSDIKNHVNVYENKLKVYLLEDIPLANMLAEETKYIDSALSKETKRTEFHKKNEYKMYCFGGLYPIEKDGVYKKGQIYTIIIRTVNMQLASYLSDSLKNHYTTAMKGLTSEIGMLPKKVINEIYTLTPVIVKTEAGYWKGHLSFEEYEKHLFANVVKKYNAYCGAKMDEDFDLYTSICFLNKKPIATGYKNIRLLGDKIALKIADNKSAQDLAYFLLGTGIGEMNGRGFGFCNSSWL